jgi:hypothetical protein
MDLEITGHDLIDVLSRFLSRATEENICYDGRCPDEVSILAYRHRYTNPVVEDNIKRDSNEACVWIRLSDVLSCLLRT